MWARLSAEQRTRLKALGLRPAEEGPGQGVEAAGSGKRTATSRAAFRRGLAALAQWMLWSPTAGSIFTEIETRPKLTAPDHTGRTTTTSRPP
ncbi:hypothetical protein CAC01_30345 [Streptomyces sp. CLI2509]|nr:hypothetical protein CAC01_30345 [Streptomyces sp. CLI2509]